MKKNNNTPSQQSENKKQTGISTKKQDTATVQKHQPVIKTPSTDGKQHTAEESSGLNESKTSREDLLPLD